MSRWIFDVEMIARYLGAGGGPEGLYELPLRAWRDVGESKVKPLDFLRSIGEMASIYRGYRGRRTPNSVVALLASPSARYAAVGAIGTVLHYLTLALAVELLGIAAHLASGLGALVGALVNYILNYHLTFASTASHAKTAPKFLVVAAASVALNASGMWLATQRLGMHYLLAQAACTLLVLVLGYVANKSWTFATSRGLPSPQAATEDSSATAVAPRGRDASV
jgi:putative flippase GtrA